MCLFILCYFFCNVYLYFCCIRLLSGKLPNNRYSPTSSYSHHEVPYKSDCSASADPPTIIPLPVPAGAGGGGSVFTFSSSLLYRFHLTFNGAETVTLFGRCAIKRYFNKDDSCYWKQLPSLLMNTLYLFGFSSEIEPVQFNRVFAVYVAYTRTWCNSLVNTVKALTQLGITSNLSLPMLDRRQAKP